MKLSWPTAVMACGLIAGFVVLEALHLQIPAWYASGVAAVLALLPALIDPRPQQR